MDNKVTIAELNHTRMELLALVNEKFNRMIECLEKGENSITSPTERIIPLTVNPSIFKSL